jgi:hypothetical protein
MGFHFLGSLIVVLYSSPHWVVVLLRETAVLWSVLVLGRTFISPEIPEEHNDNDRETEVPA